MRPVSPSGHPHFIVNLALTLNLNGFLGWARVGSRVANARQLVDGVPVPDDTRERRAYWDFVPEWPYTAATFWTIAIASQRMRRSMPAPWSTLSIAPIRCLKRERITTWWSFGPAIAGCTALGEVARRRNDSLVDLTAIRNRQPVHLGRDVFCICHGSRGYSRRRMENLEASRSATFNVRWQLAAA